MFHLTKKTAIAVGIATLCVAGTANAVVTFNDSDTFISASNAGTITAPTSLSFMGYQSGASKFLSTDGIDYVEFGLTNMASGAFTSSASSRSGAGWASFNISLWATPDESSILNRLADGTSVALGVGLGFVSYFDYSALTPESSPYFIHINGQTSASNVKASYSGNFSVSPVPEPETYAMLLAGLGLMGFVARRRKQSIAS